MHKEKLWNMQTLDELICAELNLPEAKNDLPIWKAQRGQSKTTKEIATPTHSKNSTQNQ